MQQNTPPDSTTPSGGFFDRAPIRLMLASAAILFLELALIRWIPAYLRLFGFFSNLVLLSALLGAGIGLLGSRGTRIPLPPPPVPLFALVVIVILNQFSLDLPTTQVLFYGAGEQAATQERYWVVPVIFALVVLTFVPLGQELGRQLRRLPPLRAYTVDIVGSLLGIASFALLAVLWLPPVAWFLVFALMVWPLIGSLRSGLYLGAILICVLVQGWSDIWSPYYRVMVYENAERTGYVVGVNNIGHQDAIPQAIRPQGFYFRAYDLLAPPAFRRVLIIGAGTGSDVAIALARGAEHVDAVEIDPALWAVGRQVHPDRPYDDPRVHVHIGDGRAFLRRATARYDLIIFALTDSLTLTAHQSNLRLESFLFTEESIREARDRLSDNGLLVLYNYYRETWSVRRLAGMVEAAFGTPPYVAAYGAWGYATALMAGPRLRDLPEAVRIPYVEPPPQGSPAPRGELPMIGEGFLGGDPAVVPSRDDWPFFYVREPGIPQIYVIAVALVLGLVVVGITAIAPKGSWAGISWHFFFLGVAFMLLQTRSLVVFALLFGTTWWVNALVFFAILSSVLLAILINSWIEIRRPALLYVALFAALALNWVLPASTLLEIGDATLRYAVASVVAFLPVFLANIVFSRSFKAAEQSDTAFGSNLLGIMCGGLVEYAALATGFQALVAFVALFYALALVMTPRTRAGAG